MTHRWGFEYDRHTKGFPAHIKKAVDDVFVQEAVEAEVIFGHAERDGGVVPELDFDLAKKAVGTAGKKVGITSTGLADRISFARAQGRP